MKISKTNKTELGSIVNEMIELEAEMALYPSSRLPICPSSETVTSWINKSINLSSRLDKVWKSIK